jgi:hypothetical protein
MSNSEVLALIGASMPWWAWLSIGWFSGALWMSAGYTWIIRMK